MTKNDNIKEDLKKYIKFLIEEKLHKEFLVGISAAGGFYYIEHFVNLMEEGKIPFSQALIVSLVFAISTFLAISYLIYWTSKKI